MELKRRAMTDLEAIGLRVLEEGQEKPVQRSATGTAIVRPEKHIYIRRMVASLWEFLAETDSSVHRNSNRKENHERRLDDARRRTLMDPNDPTTPYLAFVRFWIDPSDKKRRVKLELSIPSADDPNMKVTVPATPHFLFDGAGDILPYVMTKQIVQNDEEGNPQTFVEYILTTHVCLVLRPHYLGGQYRVVPFGLGDPGKIETYRQVAEEYRERGESKEKWPDIIPMPNNLRLKQGMRLLHWKPQYLNDMGNDTFSYGEIHGRKIFTKGQSNLARPDEDPNTGKPAFLKKYTFLIVSMNDAEVRVKCLGKEGEVDLRSGQFDIGGTGRLDGFAVLGIDPITANSTTVMKYALGLASAAPLDVSNPLYVYALSTGGINLKDTEEAMRVLLRPIADVAAIMVRGELIITLGDLVNKLTVIQGMPSVEEVLAGQEIEEVWNRKNGDDDTLAVWITSKMEADFSWKSWLFVNLRQEVLRAILSKEGMTPPEKKQRVKAVEAVKVEEAAPVASTEDPAATEPVASTPAAVEAAPEVLTQTVEAPMAQAGGRRRKKMTETKETAEGQA